MHRFLLILFLALSLPAQTPAPSLDKPPQDVDDALRARIKQFYELHVAAKYRQAERLIAEESKDDYYVLSKPELKNFRIGGIEYSDHFTRAKVVIIGAMPVLLPMAGGKIMDMPFASYWKIENGEWCWFYNKEASRHTPFGDTKLAQNTTPGPAPTSVPTPPDAANMLTMLQSALKIDRTRIELKEGKPEVIKVTNTLPGPASVSIDCPYKPLKETGLTATFDKKDLKGNETATLTLTPDPNAQPAIVPLRITVSPTNQVLNLSVSITR